jgi:hypothetical protein
VGHITRQFFYIDPFLLEVPLPIPVKIERKSRKDIGVLSAQNQKPPRRSNISIPEKMRLDVSFF